MKRDLLAATGFGSLAWLMPIDVRAQPYNWSGVYVGVELGAAVNNLSKATPVFATNTPITPVSTTGPFSDSPSQVQLGNVSPVGGATFGYNKQYGSLVFGVETDFSGLGGRTNYRTVTSTAPVDAAGTIGSRRTTLFASAGTDWLYTIRPRVGVAVDRLMIFGTGGFALGGTHLASSLAVDESFTDPGKAGQTTSGSQRSYGSSDAVRAGYVVGAGAEYLITDRLSFKAESLYYNLGSGQVTANGTAAFSATPVGLFAPAATAGASPAQSYTVREKFDGVIARIGLNYKLP